MAKCHKTNKWDRVAENGESVGLFPFMAYNVNKGRIKCFNIFEI